MEKNNECIEENISSYKYTHTHIVFFLCVCVRKKCACDNTKRISTKNYGKDSCRVCII